MSIRRADCWSAETRDANGNLQPDPTRFPSGIPALVSALEAIGNFSLGVYTCAGNFTCKYNRPGSYGHYAQDAATIASWGVKQIKADNCFHPDENSQVYYTQFSQAINATGVSILFSTCQWGEDNVWEWGGSIAQTFRVNNDHLPLWSFNGQGTADLIEKMAEVWNYSAPYGYGDADFIYTGLLDSEVEGYTEYGMWSMFNGPIFVATDVRNMTGWQLDVLTNAEVIALQQDELSISAHRVWYDNATQTQLWAKPLANGDQAIALYNKNDVLTQNITAQLADVGWAGATVSVRDLWARADLGSMSGSITVASVPPHGHRLLRLTKQ